ncbi:MAG: neutral zinc metallopeptidase, partial [Dehalococcoidia bacterium]|nr:neutral zinc metallopeptidase [Dehalococcoidia bacterium]
FGPVFILAHEWGHVVQDELGLLSEDTPAIALELQADCLAGAYSQDAQARGLVSEGDLQEATTSLTQAADPAGTPWYDPHAHGSAEQRVDSFRQGLDGGVSTCLDATARPGQR